MSNVPSERDIKKMLDRASMAVARELDTQAKKERERQKEKEVQERTKTWEVLRAQEARARADTGASSHAKHGGQKYPDTGEGGAKRRNYSDTGE